jgi:hypothetical protein
LDKVIIIYGLKRNLKISAPDSPLAVEHAFGHVTRSIYKFLPFMVQCINSVHLFSDTVSCRPTHSSFRFSFYLNNFKKISEKKIENAPIDFVIPIRQSVRMQQIEKRLPDFNSIIENSKQLVYIFQISLKPHKYNAHFTRRSANFLFALEINSLNRLTRPEIFADKICRGKWSVHNMSSNL